MKIAHKVFDEMPQPLFFILAGKKNVGCVNLSPIPLVNSTCGTAQESRDSMQLQLYHVQMLQLYHVRRLNCMRGSIQGSIVLNLYHSYHI
jgi:hypothetical protein